VISKKKKNTINRHLDDQLQTQTHPTPNQSPPKHPKKPHINISRHPTPYNIDMKKNPLEASD
jgi:hypothetical protein